MTKEEGYVQKSDGEEFDHIQMEGEEAWGTKECRPGLDVPFFFLRNREAQAGGYRQIVGAVPVSWNVRVIIWGRLQEVK